MSVTAAAGFRAAGVTAGLKVSGRPDVALVAADAPASAAAVFTTNTVQAAPVLQSRAAVGSGRLRAVVLNSGGANACTGAPGLADAHATAAAVAAGLGCAPGEVAVASTGLIGVRLPMEALLAGVDKAVGALDVAGGNDAATAIMTTDTVPKQAVRTVAVGEATVTVGGMAKGAGMLAPALATMLVVLTTDADVGPADLQAALSAAARATFDRIDADGCLSTNDSVYLLASGAAGVRLDPVSDGWAAFVMAVEGCCADLAGQLIDDAEGASKHIAVTVSGATTEEAALAGARAIARSALLKCAIHGEDPNWGRVLAALGTSAAAFDPDRVDVCINGVQVCTAGMGTQQEDAARAALAAREVAIDVEMHVGDERATIRTTDLTAAYVHENSAYST